MKRSIVCVQVLVVAMLCFSVLTRATGYAQTDRSQEVANYISKLQSNSRQNRIEAAKRITHSGLTDPELFDLINAELLNRYQSERGANEKTYHLHIDEMSWLCKALASSGNTSYKETLQRIADTTSNPKLKKYALQSLRLIDEYAQRNAIMVQTRYAEADMSPEVVRYINMLKSDDIKAKKDAAKSISRSNITDKRLFDVVNEELLKGYQVNTRDRHHTDTMAWLCKALAASRMPEYKATLRTVIATSSSPKLKKYALESLSRLE